VIRQSSGALEMADRDINARDAISYLFGKRAKILFIDKKYGSENG